MQDKQQAALASNLINNSNLFSNPSLPPKPVLDSIFYFADIDKTNVAAVFSRSQLPYIFRPSSTIGYTTVSIPFEGKIMNIPLPNGDLEIIYQQYRSYLNCDVLANIKFLDNLQKAVKEALKIDVNSSDILLLLENKLKEASSSLQPSLINS